MDETVIVPPTWLADRLEEPNLQVVDVREPWEFDDIGHVPGAVNVPFDRFRDGEGDEPGTLPGATAFAGLLEDAGIEPTDTVVVYDDTHGVFAARFLLTAHVYGHADVRLLDGDYSAWNRVHETTTEAPAVEPSTYEPTPLSPDESPIVDRRAVKAAIDRGALLVDTREREEFEAGHLPGAVRFDWREAVDDETRRRRPANELRALLASHGIVPDRELVLYCNTARRISHTYVVLRSLGYDDVAFYEGSLTEWLDHGGAVKTGS
ncbi:MAG: sulfurtransferase [Halobacteriota archaeon]